jgi:putative hydrolase of the HAD superfamily
MCQERLYRLVVMTQHTVIFDLFGTLVDNWPADERKRLLAGMATELGCPFESLFHIWDEHRAARDTGAFATVQEAVSAACKGMGLTVDPGRIERASGAYSEFAAVCLTPRDDALETVQRLRSLGYRTGLISDCGPPTPELWAATSLAECFDVTTFSCAVGLKKPDPRIYLTTCQALGVQPGDCLYVGDGGSRELTGAESVGMRALMIRTPSEEIVAPLRVDADSWEGTRIRSLSEVLLHLG